MVRWVPYKWLVATAFVIGLFMEILGMTVLNTALPALRPGMLRLGHDDPHYDIAVFPKSTQARGRPGRTLLLTVPGPQPMA
ncbi:hypothetical protein [Nonomuraea jabiensis]|uniref:hypothetical protein n=1 Tax=Nonomuraea jabiensis TaxID=882448 RepID=UPI003D731945